MTRTLTEFSQKKIERRMGLVGQGFCLALASRWVRHILDSEKDGWDIPKQAVGNRLQLLKDEAVALHALHQKYLARLGKARDMLDAQEALVLVAKSGFMEDRDNLCDYVKENSKIIPGLYILDAKGIYLQKSALLLMETLRVPPKGVASVTVKNIAVAEMIASELIHKSSTYVVTTKHGATRDDHAMAIYRSGGAFSTYFYIFDPNIGEVFASTLEDAAFVINELMGPGSPSNTNEWNLLRCN
ncbi:hypothetical protein ACN469_04640 [Corallococcus terminator]